MPDLKISQFATAAALTGSEQMAAVQGGANVKITPAQIATYAGVVAGGTSFGWANIKDFGAVGDGVTDDTAAFVAFKTWAVAQNPRPVALVLPPGDYHTLGFSGASFTFGINHLTVYGYGATLDVGVSLGGGGFYLDDLHSARVQTAPRGQRFVTLINGADAAKFPGSFPWVYLGGVDMQGFGYPPNHHFFEYHLITSIVGSQINFFSWLANDYKSTWPLFNAGDAFNCDLGGPATLYYLDQTWSCDQTFYGITFINSGQYYARGRNLQFVDCYFQGDTGLAPTVCKSIVFKNCSWDSYPEVDKAISYIEFSDCVMRRIYCQSSSVDRMLVNNCDVQLAFDGTAKNTVIRNSNVRSLGIGPKFYGTLESLLVENCRFTDRIFVAEEGHDEWSNWSTGASHGTLKHTGGSPPAMLVPGALVWHINSNAVAQEPFKVLDLRQSGSDTLVDTTLPHVPAPPPNPAWLQAYYNKIQFVNCVGPSSSVEMQKGGDDRPFGTYCRHTYTGYINAPYFGETLTGYIDSITIDVIRAYTGVQSTLTIKLAQFDNTPVILNPGNTAGTIGATVNLKIAGTRTILVAGNTGAQSGDTLPTLAALTWLLGHFQVGFRPFMSADISAETVDLWPIFSIEVITNHGKLATNDWRAGTIFLG